MIQILLINLLVATSSFITPQLGLAKSLSLESKPTPTVLVNDINILKSSSIGISFEYSFNDEQLSQEKVIADSKEYSVFNIKGAVRNESPGQFDIPSKEILIGIPQQGDISLTYEPIVVREVDNIEISPVPFKTWEKAPEYRIVQNNKSAFSPEMVCQIEEISYFRDIRIARIKIYPVQYNPLTKQAIVNSDIIIKVKFSRAGQEMIRPDYFDGIAKDIILNWQDAVKWKSDFMLTRSDSGYSKYPQGFLNWYKIKIESTGIYKITYNELKDAGVPVRLIDPRTIRLFNIGEYTSNQRYPDTMSEIPIYISGETDSSLDHNDYILFYGVSPARFDQNRTSFYNNPLTLYNYYWLTWGVSIGISGPGKRFEEVSSTAQTNRVYSAENYVHLEEDHDCPARSGLLWIWNFYSKLNNLSDTTFDLSLALPNPESVVSIGGRFWGQSSFNSVIISLNHTALDSFYFSGSSSGPSPADFFIERNLSLTTQPVLNFTLFGSGEQDVFFDYLNVRYLEKLELSQDRQELYFYSPAGNFGFSVSGIDDKPLVFDISNYFAPKKIVNYYRSHDTIIFGNTQTETTYYYVTDESKARTVLSIESKNPGGTQNYSNVQYFIIAPDELYESSLLFENYRDNNIAGIPQARAKAVPLSWIYDNFTFGIEEPGAIKRMFQKYRPYYGLLLGDGTYDYRNILQLMTFPPMPAYEQGYDIDYQVYSDLAIAVDAWYADFDGSGYSPDMALGRVTVRNTNEVRQFYDKLVNYENKRTTGVWNKRFLFLSDDEWKGQGIIDEFVSPSPPHIIDHVAKTENLEQSLFYSTLGNFRHYEPVKVYLTEYPFSGPTDKRKAREALISELNKGASLWSFFGHGAGFQLAHEQALRVTDIPLINNERRNFIAFFGSCGVGRFDDTKYEAIAEELVRKQDGGIATVGASKATSSDANFSFAFTLFNNLVSYPESTIGRAFLISWHNERKYHLFGDPATTPALPNNFENISSFPDTFRAGQLVINRAQGTNNFSAASYTAKWHRYYQSIYYNPSPETIMMDYDLAGYEMFRGMGRVNNDSIKFQFTVPIGVPRTRDILDGGGYFSEIPNTSRVSAITYNENQDGLTSLLADSIPFDTIPAMINDFIGPTIQFYNEDKRLKSQDKVPKQFTLTLVISDSSGILLLPTTGYNLRLKVKKASNQTIIPETDLSPYFTYDIGNYGQGRISYPVTIDTGTCVILVWASDNFRNLTMDSVRVLVDKTQNLDLANVLYYGTQNSRTGYFTFVLNKSASVGIKIYTINGRLVKMINERPCNFGYNQIVWDGLDNNGVPPANGVYFYKLQANTQVAGHDENDAVIDKLIILH
jgi:hypothetical protein